MEEREVEAAEGDSKNDYPEVIEPIKSNKQRSLFD